MTTRRHDAPNLATPSLAERLTSVLAEVQAQELQDILRRLYAGHNDGMLRHRAIDLLEQAWRNPSVLPLSAGLGSCVLSSSTPSDQLFPHDTEASPERWGWQIDRPVAWHEPQPQAGAQGFWHWPGTLRGDE